MLQVNQPIPGNIIAVLDALAELGKVVQEQNKTADSGNPGLTAVATIERQNPYSQDVDQ